MFLFSVLCIAVQVVRKQASLFFFFNDTATPDIYTLTLHDALPIWPALVRRLSYDELAQVADPLELATIDDLPKLKPLAGRLPLAQCRTLISYSAALDSYFLRSEEHTSELQSQSNLVCRLLLEKKNT